jgi:hypothetical protein
MTRAFSALLGVPMPVLGVDDADIVAGCDRGQRLKIAAPELFREQLEAITELVDTIEKFRRRR